MNPATQPEAVQADPRFGDKTERWMCQHKQFIAEAKEKEPEVLFIGDSLTERLLESDIWRKQIAFLHCLNFGIGGDQTQHVLWRLENGELDHVTPKIVVLFIGTNNHSHTAEQVAEGILQCATVISQKLPQASIVVLKLLPRGQFPNPYREKNEQVNRLIPDLLKDLPKAQVVNIDPGFVQADGTISRRDMNDFLHLSQQAYTKAFEPVYDLLSQLLSE